jgi:hypothetical protein
MAKLSEEAIKALKAAIEALGPVLEEMSPAARSAAAALASLAGYGSLKKEDAESAIEDIHVLQSGLEEGGRRNAGSDIVLLKSALGILETLLRTVLGEEEKSISVESVEPGEVKAVAAEEPLGMMKAAGYSPCPECGQAKGHKEGCSMEDKDKKAPDGAYPAPVKKSDGIFSAGRMVEEVSGTDGREWLVQLIADGKSANRTFYPTEVLDRAVPLFEGVKCYADHPIDRSGGSRSIRDIVGWFEEASRVPGGVQAKLCLLESEKWLKEKMVDAWKRGKPDLIQFSLFGEGRYKSSRVNGEVVSMVENIDRVLSVDAVSEGAAGGKLIQLINSKEEEEKKVFEIDKMTLEELKELRPDLVESLAPKKEEVVAVAPDLSKNLEELDRRYQEMESRYRKAELQVMLRESLEGSDLPSPLRQRIQEDFSSREAFTRDDLDTAISRESDIYARVVQSPPLQWTPSAKILETRQEKLTKAMDGLFIGSPVDGVKPFRSLREAFSVVKGIGYYDVDPIEMLAEGRRYDSGSHNKRLMESLTVSSWAELLGDSITRRIIAEYKQPGYDEWRSLVSDVGSVNDFRTQRRMRMGGYGTLPTVAEAGPYTSLSSPTDEEATYAVSKKGGTEDLTLETVANDDVGAVRRIPKQLALAAKVTLYQFVFDFLRTNATCTYDSVELLAAAHANMSTAVLSDSELTLGKIAMRSQTAYGVSSQFPGFKPKFLVVPNELEAKSIQLRDGQFALRPTGMGAGTANEINVHKGTFEIIVCDYFTDPDQWYLVADPALWPTIEVGFFGGRQDPELLTQDQEYVGNVFSNDKITYKIRHIYGGAILDHRAFYGYGG